jgi:hypothetical protein
MNSYFRCTHMNEQGQQCDNWFKAEGTNKLCEEHQVFLRVRPEDPTRIDEEKPAYIDLVNEQINVCAKMNLDELEQHISSLERALETEKTKLYAARANLRQKLDDLSDDERKIRLSHKISKSINSEPKKSNVKKDPIAHLASKHGLSSQAAKDLMNMDLDSLMEKYNKSKEKPNA